MLQNSLPFLHRRRLPLPSWSCQSACCKTDDPAQQSGLHLQSIINRTCNNKTIRRFKFGGNLIYNIIKHTFSSHYALAARYAAPNILVSDLYDVCFNALDVKCLCHFINRDRCVSVYSWTSVNNQNFHLLP